MRVVAGMLTALAVGVIAVCAVAAGLRASADGSPVVADTIRIGWGGYGPWGVAVNPNTNRIYVANDLDDTVSVIQDSPIPTPTPTRAPPPTPAGPPGDGGTVKLPPAAFAAESDAPAWGSGCGPAAYAALAGAAIAWYVRRRWLT